jgi:hypothetical protein
MHVPDHPALSPAKTQLPAPRGDQALDEEEDGAEEDGERVALRDEAAVLDCGREGALELLLALEVPASEDLGVSGSVSACCGVRAVLVVVVLVPA